MKYDLLNDPKIEYISYSKSSYKDINGNECNELILCFKLCNENLNSDGIISIFSNPYFIYIKNNIIKIRIPIIYGELKKYFDNYKDYYYLPLEDMCILKIIGQAVDNKYKENAKKETCYIKYSGFFIPNLDNTASGFKFDYTSKISYKEFIEENQTPETYKEYALKLIKKLNN